MFCKLVYKAHNVIHDSMLPETQICYNLLPWPWLNSCNQFKAYKWQKFNLFFLDYKLHMVTQTRMKLHTSLVHDQMVCHNILVFSSCLKIKLSIDFFKKFLISSGFSGIALRLTILHPIFYQISSQVQLMNGNVHMHRQLVYLLKFWDLSVIFSDSKKVCRSEQ